MLLSHLHLFLTLISSGKSVYVTSARFRIILSMMEVRNNDPLQGFTEDIFIDRYGSLCDYSLQTCICHFYRIFAVKRLLPSFY